MASILDGLRGAWRGAQRARSARIERDKHAPATIPDDHLYCTRCGHLGKPDTHTPGHILVEVVLWLTFLLPGVIYTIWRHHKRQAVCSSCGSDALIPHDSPRARAERKKLRA